MPPRGPYKKRKSAQPCPYCGELFYGGAGVMHSRTCFDNPALIERLRDFMQTHADDGVALSERYYKILSGGTGLPSVRSIIQRFETWPAFAEWCGLITITQAQQAKGISELQHDYSPLNAPNPEGISGIRDNWRDGMACAPALRCVREWNPKQKVYEPKHWQKVLVIR